MLGGSSSINAMMWVRGSRHDYDQWAMNGAEGWSYAEVLPYFIRMEDSKAAEVDRGTTLKITYHSHQVPTFGFK